LKKIKKEQKELQVKKTLNLEKKEEKRQELENNRVYLLIINDRKQGHQIIKNLESIQKRRTDLEVSSFQNLC